MHLVDRASVVMQCHYSESFDVFFQQDNLFGCQFHPEKSQQAGLNFLDSFLNA